MIILSGQMNNIQIFHTDNYKKKKCSNNGNDMEQTPSIITYHKGGLALNSSERRKRHAQAYCGGC